MSKHYLYSRGDGNEGNFVRAIIELKDEQSPWAALPALVANDYIAGKRVRKHIIRNIQTDGEADYGIYATVYEGPDGEDAFGAAWLTAELQPLMPEDVDYYTGRPGMQSQTLRDALDPAAWRMFRSLSRSEQ